jgi:hypothetical protein
LAADGGNPFNIDDSGSPLGDSALPVGEAGFESGTQQ